MKDKLVIQPKRLWLFALGCLGFGVVFLYAAIDEISQDYRQWQSYLMILLGVGGVIWGCYMLFKKNPKLVFDVSDDLQLTCYDENNILTKPSSYDIPQIKEFLLTQKNSEGVTDGTKIIMIYKGKQEVAFVDLDGTKLSREQTLQIVNFVCKQDGGYAGIYKEKKP